MNNQPTFTQKYSAIIKMAMIGVLVILLLIPSFMVQEVISERERNQDNVKEEISSKWGQGQTITGPIINIPYYEYRKNTYNQKEKELKYIHLLPESLDIEGRLDTSILSRSIYDVMAYRTQLKVKGTFSGEQLAKTGNIPLTAQWDKATISIGISDLKGVQDGIHLIWGEDSMDFNPGIENRDIFNSGVSAPISFGTSETTSLGFKASDMINFSFDLNLKGSDYLRFIPVGKETKVKISSTCPNPNFYGNFLPAHRNVTEDGFVGEWKILHLNRNFPQAWKNEEQNMNNSWFGVELMIGVDPYQKTMRSAKYAILFIAMTFLTFFFIEILGNKRIHPIQYILIGLVLVLFYVLLLSMSEQLGFSAAYFIGSLAVILLITIYTASVLHSTKQSMVMFTILTVLYGFIYIIIQLAEYSLLFGSIGLFLFLAAVMLASRKVDWYSIGLKEKK